MRQKARRHFFALVVLVVSGFFSLIEPQAQATAEQTFVLIVHPENPVSELSRKEISRIFLKRSGWPNGDRPLPVEQKSGTLSEEFSTTIHGRSAFAVRAEWKKRLFSGQGMPPPQLSKDLEIVEYVRERPRAIGYVAASTSLEGVKTLRVQD